MTEQKYENLIEYIRMQYDISKLISNLSVALILMILAIVTFMKKQVVYIEIFAYAAFGLMLLIVLCLIHLCILSYMRYEFGRDGSASAQNTTIARLLDVFVPVLFVVAIGVVAALLIVNFDILVSGDTS